MVTKQGILRITHELSSHVAVVSNVLPAAFKAMDNTPITDEKWINIAAVGAPVPHKNFDIIPSVLLELKRQGLPNVRFHTTIPFNHLLAERIKNVLENNGLADNWVNHGRVSQKELGEMYRRCQFAFLPTLLEVFSASTVEAMYFNLPIVATKFDFNTEVLEDSCLYYEPKNAQDAARQIVKLIKENGLQEECKKKMRMELSKYGDYDAHFNAIKKFLVDVANIKLVPQINI